MKKTVVMRKGDMKKLFLGFMLLLSNSKDKAKAQAIDLVMDKDGYIEGDVLYSTAMSMYNRIHVPKGVELYFTESGKQEELQKVGDTIYKLNIGFSQHTDCDTFSLQVQQGSAVVSRSYAVKLFKPGLMFRIGYLVDRDQCSIDEMERQIEKGISVYIQYSFRATKALVDYYTVKPTRFQCVFFSGDKQLGNYDLHNAAELKTAWTETNQAAKPDRIVITGIRGASPLGEVRLAPAVFFITQ